MKILSITPLGSQVYAVRDSLHKTRTVSLRAFEWNGSCDCPTFTDCCKPLLDLGSEKRWRCDHIIAARQWMMEHEMPKVLKELEDENIVVLPEFDSAAQG